MLSDRVVWALYHVPSKSFVMCAGYYGVDHNIKAFRVKEDCELHIKTFYRDSGYIAKKMRIA